MQQLRKVARNNFCEPWEFGGEEGKKFATGPEEISF